jgi:23S rRNA pseudouridine1911/1915/1917 synthase
VPRNDGYVYDERLGPEAEDEPLLAYLCRRYRHSTASEWTVRIASGQLLVDGKPAKPAAALRRGQHVAWNRPPWEEPEAPLDFAVLHEDADLLAVHKPAGLPTLPGANFLRSTLLHQVRRYAPDATAVHRLGRWTSGLVLFARSRPARVELARQLGAREISKRYRALAAGDPAWDAIEINRPIGLVPHRLLGSVHAAAPEGKPAASRIDVVERRGGAFLCDVRIATGRPHQIRIHLASAGHPLVGDPLYVAGGVPAEATGAVPGDPGYLLHAAEATLRHPRTLREIVLTCSPPPALRRAPRWNDARGGTTLGDHELVDS